MRLLDPMSNTSYRIFLLRVVPESRWFQIATGALIILLILAAAAAVVAFRRREPPSTGVDAETMVT